MTVGETIQLSVVGFDEEGDAIEYTWFGSGGVFTPPDAVSTLYDCAEAGVHTLGVVLSDDGFDQCAEGWTTDIECASGPPPAPAQLDLRLDFRERPVRLRYDPPATLRND